MKRFNKILTAALAAVMAFALVGCGGGGTSGGEFKYRGKNVLDNLGSETGTISFGIGGGADELKLWDELCDAFETENPGIKIRQVSIGNDDTLYTQLASGNAPDVIQVDSSLFGNWAKTGALMSIQPFIDRDNFDTSDFWPQAKQMFTFDTKNGIRVNDTTASNVDTSGAELFSLPKDFGVNGIFVNRDLIESAKNAGKLTDEQYRLVTDQINPMTYEEYLDIAVALTNDTGSAGTTVYGTNRIYWESYMWSLGEDLIGADNQLNMNSAGVKKVFEYSKEMVTKGSEHYCAPYTPSSGTSSQDEMSQFTTGRIAMYWSGRWNVPAYDASNVDYYCIPCPVAVKADGSKGTPVGWCATVGYSISRNCKNTQMAWKFIQFLTSPEGYRVMNKLNYAVPGRMSLVTEAAFANPKEENTNSLVRSKLDAASAKTFFDMAKIARINNSARYSSPAWITEFEKKLELYFVNDIKTVEDLFAQTQKSVNAAIKKSDPQLF